jgi:hypothetical protein
VPGNSRDEEADEVLDQQPIRPAQVVIAASYLHLEE